MVSDDDLEHVCWGIYDSGKAVEVHNTSLTFAERSSSSSNENNPEAAEQIVQLYLTDMKKWRGNMEAEHERNKEDNNTIDTLNQEVRLCLTLENEGLLEIAKTFFQSKQIMIW